MMPLKMYVHMNTMRIIDGSSQNPFRGRQNNHRELTFRLPPVSSNIQDRFLPRLAC